MNENAASNHHRQLPARSLTKSHYGSKRKESTNNKQTSSTCLVIAKKKVHGYDDQPTATSLSFLLPPVRLLANAQSMTWKTEQRTVTRSNPGPSTLYLHDLLEIHLFIP